jgi:hypothetical protein
MSRHTNLYYLRAHQYLYYVLGTPVLSDYDYDKFGRYSGEEYKGGSDRASDYTPEQIRLANNILARKEDPLPYPV